MRHDRNKVILLSLQMVSRTRQSCRWGEEAGQFTGSQMQRKSRERAGLLMSRQTGKKCWKYSHYPENNLATAVQSLRAFCCLSNCPLSLQLSLYSVVNQPVPGRRRWKVGRFRLVRPKFEILELHHFIS